MDEFQTIREAYDRIMPMPEAEWQDFAGRLRPNRFGKGDFLIREGQTENRIHFLTAGATRNYFIRDGKEFTVDFHFKNDFVTAYYSFISREPSEIFIGSLEDTETLSIDHASLQEFYNRYHMGERIGRLMAEYQYMKRLRREMDFLSLTAEQRYKALLDKAPDLITNLSVKHLSSYLGVRPESLSRIRKASLRN
jgi:CRP/FNR family transcriptional regulator, anaerobic regulatory protein